MRITEEQERILGSLHCERLSSNVDNFRLVDDFYGGGDNFYSRLFYFRCAKDNLYLYKIIETHTILNSDKVITKKQYMQPQINITKFNILNYIENTP